MNNYSTIYKNYEYFIYATRYKIKHGGPNGGKLKQKDFAEAIDCSPEHLSGILSPRQLRRASLSLQEKVADYFKMSLIDFLNLGRQLHDGKKPIDDMNDAWSTLSPLQLPLVPDKASSISTPEEVMTAVAGLVTDLRQAKEEMTKWRGIVEAIGDGIVVTDTKMVIQYQNQAHRNMLGLSSTGRVCNDPEICKIPFTRCPVTAALKDGQTHSSFEMLNGKAIFVTASPIRDASGQIVAAVQVIRDIRKIQKLMHENREMRENLAAVIEKLPQPVMLYNERMRIIYYNKRFKNTAEATDKDLKTIETLRTHLRRLGKATNVNEFFDWMQDIIDIREESRIELRYRDGSIKIFTFEPITIDNGKFIGLMTTVTDKKR